jgi:hypothetical protein
MTMQNEDPLIIGYRDTLDDIPTPNLDRVVLLAAQRHAARRRAGRRLVAVVLLGALAALTTGLAHRGQNVQRLPAATNYGWSEGASREYLLSTEFGKYPASELIEGPT